MRFPNSYGSVIKLSGKRRNPYGVRVTIGWDGNKQIRKYVGYYRTKTEAVKALAEYNTNPYDLTAHKITFSEVWEHWKKGEYESAPESSQKSWRTGYKHCEPIYNMKMTDIKFMHLEPLLDDKGISTQRKIKAICSKLFKYALKHEWIEKNPSEHLELKNMDEPKKVAEVFTNKEIREIWRKSRFDDFYELVIILLYSGLRISELLEIKQENVFEDYMVGGLKTDAGRNRIIPIHWEIRDLIHKRMDGSELLVDMTYPQFYKEFNKRIKNHNIHDTRHTFISKLHSAGADPVALKMIVGHSQSDITSKVYIHKNKDELLEEVNKFTTKL